MISLEEKSVLFQTLHIGGLGHFMSTLASSIHMEPFQIMLYENANPSILINSFTEIDLQTLRDREIAKERRFANLLQVVPFSLNFFRKIAPTFNFWRQQ